MVVRNQYCKRYYSNYNLPIAVPSVVDTVIVILSDDGLVRINTGCNTLFSMTVYVECSKFTVEAIK